RLVRGDRRAVVGEGEGAAGGVADSGPAVAAGGDRPGRRDRAVPERGRVRPGPRGALGGRPGPARRADARARRSRPGGPAAVLPPAVRRPRLPAGGGVPAAGAG